MLILHSGLLELRESRCNSSNFLNVYLFQVVFKKHALSLWCSRCTFINQLAVNVIQLTRGSRDFVKINKQKNFNHANYYLHSDIMHALA